MSKIDYQTKYGNYINVEKCYTSNRKKLYKEGYYIIGGHASWYCSATCAMCRDIQYSNSTSTYLHYIVQKCSTQSQGIKPHPGINTFPPLPELLFMIGIIVDSILYFRHAST